RCGRLPAPPLRDIPRPSRASSATRTCADLGPAPGRPTGAPAVPAPRVPVAALVGATGRVGRPCHHMGGADRDLVVASGAPVGLRRSRSRYGTHRETLVLRTRRAVLGPHRRETRIATRFVVAGPLPCRPGSVTAWHGDQNNLN